MDLLRRCNLCLQCLPFPEFGAQVSSSQADSSTSQYHEDGELSSTPAVGEHVAVNAVKEGVGSELNSKPSASSLTATDAINGQVEAGEVTLSGAALEEDQGLRTAPVTSMGSDSTALTSEHGTLSESTAAGTSESHEDMTGPSLVLVAHNEQFPLSDLQADAVNLVTVDSAGESYEASMDSFSAASNLTFEVPASSDQQQQHRGRHRQQLRQQLRGLRQQLKQGGHHIKEEGNRHLQTILNNINDIKNQQSMAPQIDR